MSKKINGLNVNIKGDSNNKAIIFVHGFPYDSQMWEAQVRRLKENYYTITYDARGMGKSEAGDGQYTMELFSDDVLNLVDELNLNEPVLCGLSMGGYIALRTLEKNQSAFGGAILCNTKAFPDNDEVKIKRAEGIKAINENGLGAYVETLLPNNFSDLFIKENKKEYEKYLKISKGLNPLAVKGCLLAMVSRTDTSPFLSKLKLPTLVIAGTMDALTPAEQMREMAGKIPNSDFAVAPRAAHMTPIENSDFVNDVIEGFMRKNF